MENIKISNYLNTTLKRDVKIHSLLIDEDEKRIEFKYTSFCYDESDNEIARLRKTDFLIADNNSRVNEQGDYYTQNEIDDYDKEQKEQHDKGEIEEVKKIGIGEFDFWVSFLENRTFIKNDVYEMVVTKADKYKLFD